MSDDHDIAGILDICIVGDAVLLIFNKLLNPRRAEVLIEIGLKGPFKTVLKLTLLDGF